MQRMNKVKARQTKALFLSLAALAINLAMIVLFAAIGLSLTGCAQKYEVVRADRWIIHDGKIIGEKGKLTSAIEVTDGESAVKEESANGGYCDNEPKQLNNGDLNGGRVKARLGDNARLSSDRDTNNRFNRDRNATNRKTLALYKGKPIEAIEEAWVRSVIPHTSVELIRRSPIVNIYTAFLSNGQIVYVNPAQRLLFFGEIYNASSGENLTNLAKERFGELRSKAAEINATELETLGFGEIGKEERFVAMVSSPLCPYCHKADEFLSSNQIPVKRIFLVNQQSSDSEDVKRAVEYLTTAKEQREALLVKWRSAEGYEAPPVGEIISQATKEAIALLTAMSKFAARENIEGTPYIYLVNRKSNKVDRLITGYDAATTGEAIKAWYQGEGQ